ncbi:MAG: hypothetical protein KW788_03675 [Candidatus Doudnabacteria bacterium]|nr:hypothetical protein [Candidatus Doudnabacteria bacterium]
MKIYLNPTEDGEWRAKSEDGQDQSFGPDQAWALHTFLLEHPNLGIEIEESSVQVPSET